VRSRLCTGEVWSPETRGGPLAHTGVGIRPSVSLTAAYFRIPPVSSDNCIIEEDSLIVRDDLDSLLKVRGVQI
jgi:hypothetical protein